MVLLQPAGRIVVIARLVWAVPGYLAVAVTGTMHSLSSAKGGYWQKQPNQRPVSKMRIDAATAGWGTGIGGIS
jgi:hypothetical protein